MRRVCVILVLLSLAGCAVAQQPEVAILKNTSSAEARPDDVRTVEQYLGIVRDRKSVV